MAARYSAPTATPDTGSRDAGFPDYIFERNRLADQAGLAITKQSVRDGKLTTWYEGSEAQWRSGPFGCRRKKPFPQKRGASVSDYFEAFTPISCRGMTWFRVTSLGDGKYRGSIANEILPEWAEDMGGGITAYAGKDDLCRKSTAMYYVGPLDALVARGIIPQNDLAQRAARDNHDYIVLNEQFATVQFLGDRRVIYCDRTGQRERGALEAAEKHKKSYASTSAMLAHWAAVTETWSRMHAEMFQRTETRQGKVFTVSRDSMSAIRDLTDELIDAIRCAQVTVRDAQPNIAPAIAAARADRAFTQFLRRASSSSDIQPPH